MFARTRIPGAVLAVTVFLTPGCQMPDATPGKSVSQQQQKRAALTEPSADVEMTPAKIEAATYLAAAHLHESQGRLLPAIQQYCFAIKEDPSNADILGHMGVLYDRIGNGPAAQDAYQRALRIKPDNAVLRNNLAFSYIVHKQWTKAEAELNQALAIAPEFARARMNLAMTQAQLDRYDEAFKSFSLMLPPEDAHYNMGLMYQSRRKLVEAAEQYKRALKVNPKLAAAQQQLKKMPAATLSEAARRLDAEQKAIELAAKTAKQERPVDPRTSAATTSRPAAAIESAALDDGAVRGRQLLADNKAWDTTFGADSYDPRAMKERIMLHSLMPDLSNPAATLQPASAQPASRPAEQASKVTAIKSAELTALLTSPSVFNLPPQDDSALRGLLGAGLAAQLDAILPPWQRTPGLIVELSTNVSLMSSPPGDRWSDWVESPLPPLERDPIRTIRTEQSK